jgi:hypothetical protein
MTVPEKASLLSSESQQLAIAAILLQVIAATE